MLASAMSLSLCVDVMVMSPAYVVSFTSACGDGMAYVYLLNTVYCR